MNLRDYLIREDKRLASALPKGKPGCKFPGCQLPHRARGYCDSHYTQLMRGQKLRKIHPKQGAGNRFAKQIGVVPTTVYMYAAGERYPQPDIMAKIVKVTDGEVGPIDFLRQRKPRPARKKRPKARGFRAVLRTAGPRHTRKASATRITAGSWRASRWCRLYVGRSEQQGDGDDAKAHHTCRDLSVPGGHQNHLGTHPP